jgi:CBASS immunity effector Cap15-like protein
MRNDLRGFLPRKCLGRLLKWFDKHIDRESAGECLARELREELREINLPNASPPSNLQVKLVRRVEEGPEKVPGRAYTQFRIFEVYDVSGYNAEYVTLMNYLKQLSKTSRDLILADSSDIVHGRCEDGRVIGNHVLYLLGKKRTRPEPPPFGKA